MQGRHECSRRRLSCVLQYFYATTTNETGPSAAWHCRRQKLAAEWYATSLPFRTCTLKYLKRGRIVIPDYSKMKWIARAPTSVEVEALVKRVLNCLRWVWKKRILITLLLRMLTFNFRNFLGQQPLRPNVKSKFRLKSRILISIRTLYWVSLSPHPYWICMLNRGMSPL